MKITAINGSCQIFHCNPLNSVVVFNNVKKFLIPEVSVRSICTTEQLWACRFTEYSKSP
jgi:hypothetical protein